MFIQRLRHGIILAGLILLAAVLGAQDTTVVLFRHAERQSLFDGDSQLSEAGLRRAQALVPLLAGFQPVAAYTSDLRRTQQTMAPTALQLGLTPHVRPKDGSAALAAEILRDQRGKTVLVCWHHDLMKQVVRGLGVKGPMPYWSIDTYDRLWIVRVPMRGEATLENRQQVLVGSSETGK
jgi:2,3-bisphosphoglycerate-dependent phosphoglycerate mutase